MSSEKTAIERLHELLDERGVEWKAGESEIDHVTMWKANGGHAEFYESKTTNPDLLQVNYYNLTPEQAIAATLGNERIAFLEEKVKRQGEYIVKLDKEKRALFAENCEAATRYAGQMDRMQRKLEAATLDRGTCHDAAGKQMAFFACSACGATNEHKHPKFCYGCGRKVVDE